MHIKFRVDGRRRRRSVFKIEGRGARFQWVEAGEVLAMESVERCKLLVQKEVQAAVDFGAWCILSLAEKNNGSKLLSELFC